MTRSPAGCPADGRARSRRRRGQGREGHPADGRGRRAQAHRPQQAAGREEGGGHQAGLGHRRPGARRAQHIPDLPRPVDGPQRGIGLLADGQLGLEAQLVGHDAAGLDGRHGVVGDGVSVMVEGHGRGPPSVSTHPVPRGRPGSDREPARHRRRGAGEVGVQEAGLQAALAVDRLGLAVVALGLGVGQRGSGLSKRAWWKVWPRTVPSGSSAACRPRLTRRGLMRASPGSRPQPAWRVPWASVSPSARASMPPHSATRGRPAAWWACRLRRVRWAAARVAACSSG
jgi:hypothetical protein